MFGDVFLCKITQFGIKLVAVLTFLRYFIDNGTGVHVIHAQFVNWATFNRLDDYV